MNKIITFSENACNFFESSITSFVHRSDQDQEDNIVIPEEISLLGIDDDEFLCNISQPKLSSIHLDFSKQGEELAKAMIDMVNSNKVYPVRIPIRASKIVERESTLHHNIKDVHVRKIVKYLEKMYNRCAFCCVKRTCPFH